MLLAVSSRTHTATKSASELKWMREYVKWKNGSMPNAHVFAEPNYVQQPQNNMGKYRDSLAQSRAEIIAREATQSRQPGSSFDGEAVANGASSVTSATLKRLTQDQLNATESEIRTAATARNVYRTNPQTGSRTMSNSAEAKRLDNALKLISCEWTRRENANKK